MHVLNYMVVLKVIMYLCVSDLNIWVLCPTIFLLMSMATIFHYKFDTIKLLYYFYSNRNIQKEVDS